jgi:hypothetical protein
MGHDEASQVGVPLETDTEHVEISRSYQFAEGRISVTLRTSGHCRAAFQPKALADS